MPMGSVSSPLRKEVAPATAPEATAEAVSGALLEMTPQEVPVAVPMTIPEVAPIETPTTEVAPSEPNLRPTEGEPEERESLEMK